ncbi:MAG: phytoene desaturase family protein [Actinomycetota bacterium]
MRGYFRDERVLDSLFCPGKFCGLPPSLAPGIFAFLSYAEHEGTYFPREGMIAIPEALRRCGEKFGMKVWPRKRVEEVMVRNREVEGVLLADGTEITARVVVSNVSAKTLYLDMIGEEHLPWLPRYGITSYRLSASAPMINVGLDYRPLLDAHHTLVTESMDRMNEYWFGDMRKGLFPRRSSAWSVFPPITIPRWRRRAIMCSTSSSPTRTASRSWTGTGTRGPAGNGSWSGLVRGPFPAWPNA